MCSAIPCRSLPQKPSWRRQFNSSFTAMASDMTGAAPTDVAPDSLPAGSPAYYTDLDYTVTARHGRLPERFAHQPSVPGATAKRKAGLPAPSLSMAFTRGRLYRCRRRWGWETADNAATPETTYAAELAYGLVWRIIAEQQAMQLKGLFSGVNANGYARCVQPRKRFLS